MSDLSVNPYAQLHTDNDFYSSSAISDPDIIYIDGNVNDPIDMNEQNAAIQLHDTVTQSSTSNHDLTTYNNERIQRAQSLVSNSDSSADVIQEWLLILNSFIYIDYGITRQVDFHFYKHPSNVDIVYEPEEVMTHPEPYKSALRNLFNKFVYRIQGKVVNVYGELDRFIDDFYVADPNRASRTDNITNYPELAILHQISPQLSTYQLAVDIVKYIINKLFHIEVNYDVSDNRPRKLASVVEEFINERFPRDLDPQLTLKLPAQVIDSMCDYAMIETDPTTNLRTINTEQSLKAFHALMNSRFEALPLLITLRHDYPSERNIGLQTTLREQTIVLRTESTPIQSLERIGTHNTYNQILTRQPSVQIQFVETEPNNQQAIIRRLLDTYNNRQLLVSSFITGNPFHRELFFIAKLLFNAFEFYKAINICRYIGFASQNENILYNNSVNDASSTKTEYDYHILTEPIVSDQTVSTKPTEPKKSEFDCLLFSVYRQRNIKIILWFTLIVVLIVVLCAVGYYVHCQKRNDHYRSKCRLPSCYRERFMLPTVTVKSNRASVL